MSGAFNIFVYGTLRRGGNAESVLEGAERLGAATVQGFLYDTDNGFPALVLGGGGRVHGEIWRCASPLLWRLDEYEGIDDGLFRRVGVRIGDLACWTYVAGPRLSRLLTPDRRVASGAWK